MPSMSPRLVALAALSAALCACTPVRSYHGYVLERTSEDGFQDQDGGSDLKPVTAEIGADSKETILAKYGEPSTISTFNGDIWYYISSRERRYAFFEDKTTWRQIVAIHFGPGGLVAQVKDYGLEDGRELALVGRETPTKGKELTLLEQIFGNVGQLPAPGGGDVGGPGGPEAP